MKHKIYWTVEKIEHRLELIKPLEYMEKRPLPPFKYMKLNGPELPAPIGPEIDDAQWEEIAPNSYWGEWETNFVLRTHFSLPSEWRGVAGIALSLPLGVAGDFFCHPESLAYVDGKSYTSADRHHHELMVLDEWIDGTSHLLALHGWTGLGAYPTQAGVKTKLFMRECSLVQIHFPTRYFIHLSKMAVDVAKQLDDNNPVKNRILNVLNEAFQVLDTRSPLGGDFYESVMPAYQALYEGLQKAGSPMDFSIIGVGHAHIDVAWLWQVGQTRRKCGRTFSNALRMIEEYPDYHFSQSQPQLYRYTEIDYPELFENIKQRVQEGRWEPMGATWVEMDTNASGAESLVRQFLLGRSYFQKHFGESSDTPVLWLPDTFGFSWALPQLMQQAEVKYFVTSKISWNQYNPMPYQLFWWQGIDGTRILTHFITTPHEITNLNYSTTYNGLMDAQEVIGTWESFQQKETYDELITVYGYGDGGGGPNHELLDNAKILAEMPGAPRVRMGTVKEFMERVEETASDNLPAWNGEFYLELHRGTLTSQARTKRNNRKCEFLLHDAEFLATMAVQQAGMSYPQAILQEAWELICLNQFHDILPGSSIGAVYDDCDHDYAKVKNLGNQVLVDSLKVLKPVMHQETCAVAINPTSFQSNGIGFISKPLSGGLVDLRDGKPLLTQAIEGGTLVALQEVSPYSILALGETDASAGTSSLKITQTKTAIHLENDCLAVEISDRGALTSLYDKEAQRSVLAPGVWGNQLLIFEDRPLQWDAWDIESYYEDRVESVEDLQRIKVIETGPIRATVLLEWRFRSSRIIQKVHLYYHSKRIDFDTQIDWQEDHFLLKVAFPVDVLSPMATYDIQWGNVERPTHRNTSWDWARFEVAAQKWADLSEGNYGVALLNDCKYGYDIHDNVMRLTLLKSATMPDPQADQGEHHMVYSLLPHTGDWRNGVAAQAYDLNNPLRLQPLENPQGETTLLQCAWVDQPNVILETVKQAENGDGIILRLYEGERTRGPVTLHFGFEVAQVKRCNLLEKDSDSLDVQNNTVTFPIKPYEIVSLRCIPKKK